MDIIIDFCHPYYRHRLHSGLVTAIIIAIFIIITIIILKNLCHAYKRMSANPRLPSEELVEPASIASRPVLLCY